MKRVIFILSLLLVWTCAIRAETESEGTVASGKVKDGYALLNDLTKIFEEIAGTGKGLGSANERLSAVIADTRATFAAGQIDAVFHHRFRRLLLVFKLILTPVDVNNDVWEPVIKKELSEFVLDTLGEVWVWRVKGLDSIERMAAAVEEEFVNLWLYLDTRSQRQELKKKFAGSMLPPPPAKKKE